MEKRYDKGYTREQIAQVKIKIKTMVAQQKGEDEWKKPEEHVQKGQQLQGIYIKSHKRLVDLNIKRADHQIMSDEEKAEHEVLSKSVYQLSSEYGNWLSVDHHRYPKPDAWVMTKMLNIYHFIRGSDFRHAPLQIASGRQPVIDESVVEKVMGFRPE